jgi:hypothetical protein
MKTPLFRLAVVFSTSWLLVTSAMAQVINGDFETGALAPFTVTASNPFPGVTSTTPHAGQYHFRGYDNAGDGDLSQSLSTVTGSTYTISAWVSTSGSTNNVARLALGSSTPVNCPQLASTYALCTASFVAQTNNDALHVYFSTTDGSGTVYVDDIQVALAQPPAAVQPVPTLSTGLLALLSLLLLIGAAWRARQSR